MKKKSVNQKSKLKENEIGFFLPKNFEIRKTEISEIDNFSIFQNIFFFNKKQLHN